MNIRFSLLISVLLLLLILLSCGRSDETATRLTDGRLSTYITGHTTGMISSEGEIRVYLAEPVETKPGRGSRFSFTPSVRGEEYWIDDQTIAFRPSSPMKSGTDYKYKFRLGDLKQVPEEYREVTFGFSTLHQDLEVEISDISISDDDAFLIRGTVLTADAAKAEEIQKTLRAEVDGRIPVIRWPEGSSRTRFDFEIADVDRSSADAKLRLRWDGSAIGSRSTGVKEIPIPATGKFTLIDKRVTYDQNPHIELTFSDRLDQQQNLHGLIRLGDDDQLNTLIQGNRIRVFYQPPEEAESVTLHIESGIRSTAGRTLDDRFEEKVRLRRVMPEVRLVGRGTILPTSENMLIPFESIGLGAVDVHVERIYESNIPQFLQVNDLQGDREIRRVGKKVAGKTIPLTTLGTFDPQKWSQFALDLSSLMEAEPGALYRVTLGFRPHHRAIVCPGETLPGNFADLDPGYWKLSATEEREWWENEYDDFWWHPNYNWQERNNPCSDSYYNRNQWANRNLLGSDLGIIVKGSETGAKEVFVTDLNTTRARSGAEISFYDFQRRLMAQARTDRNGHARVELSDEPALLIASDGRSKGYVRLESGRALSLSTYDVSGTNTQKGMKGFIYGERGVWRPGDSLFVTLIVDDMKGTLPKNHPVQFELRNPQGQVFERKTVTGGINGFYTYHTKTDASSPTGIWSVSATVGGARFSRNLRIETVRPNRLDIKLDLDESEITGTERLLSGTLRSSWLHGASASNLRTDISLTTNAAPMRFTDHPSFVFDDVTRGFEAQTETIFEGRLDGVGETTFRYELPFSTGMPGRLRGNLTTRVFERSGNYSTVRDAFNYYPYRHYIGLELPAPDSETGGLTRNESHDFRVLSLDADGNPVSRNDLELTIYELGWRWWWQEPGHGTGIYFSTEYLEPIANTVVQTGKNGVGVASIQLPEVYGRILVRVEDPRHGHASSDLAYVGYSWRDDQNGEGPARLAISTDREFYKTGEKARISFPSSEGNRALVSLETGSQILRTFWTDTKAGETVIDLETTSEMSPNVYAHVMMLQPHGQMKNDLPIRMYGVVPVLVEDPGTRLNPELVLPSETRPNESIKVKVSEKNGKRMTYTLAVVDEGLLSLTNFRTPDPHTHFFAREALGIKTWDMFDHVAGPYTGSMSRILAVGGDRDPGEVSREPEITRFKPVVRFLGPFTLERGQNAEHEIDIPNYIGSVRVMVTAGSDRAYGNTSGNIPVRQSLMALATLPRVLGPGERVDLPVTLFTGKNVRGEVGVSLETSPNLSIRGDEHQFLRMDEDDQQLAVFGINVAESVGAANVTARASAAGEEAHDSIDIEIRNPNPPVTRVYEQMIEPGANWELTPGLPGVSGTNRVTLEISSITPLDLDRRLRFLITYPHGCLEQIVSSVFPQLYLANFHELTEDQSERIETHVRDAITRIRTFQIADGSLAYWPGRGGVNEWSNIYTWHFLIEAARKGYHVPENLKTGLERSIRAKALAWRPAENRNDGLIQAYRLYTLALNGTAESGAMNRLREHLDQDSQVRWRLAAAYHLAGHPEAAVAVASRSVKTAPEYRELGNTFGSRLRDRALILEALSMMDRRTEALDLAQSIAEELNSGRHLSTQEAAFSLIAMGRYLEGIATDTQLAAAFSYGEERGTISSTLPVSSISLEPEEDGTLRIDNEGDGNIFARLIVSGIPFEGEKDPASNALSIHVRYLDMDGEEIDPERLIQGTDVIVETQVSHPGVRERYTEMALHHIMPSGWEIRNTRMDGIEFSTPTSSFDYQDIRDDRVLTYFSLNPDETRVFRTVVNASYIGRYYLPSVSSYAMYDERIFARTGGKWIQVVSEF